MFVATKAAIILGHIGRMITSASPRASDGGWFYVVEFIPNMFPHVWQQLSSTVDTSLDVCQAYANAFLQTSGGEVLAVRILRRKALGQWQPLHYWTWNGSNWSKVF